MITRRSFHAMLASSYPVWRAWAQKTPAPPPPPRALWAVLDVTPSFLPRADSVRKIAAAVRSLGPGDTFGFALLGGKYAVAVVAAFGGGSVKLQALGPDGKIHFDELADNFTRVMSH